jgi:predicted enzyme related to lactoylglutathione lyase
LGKQIHVKPFLLLLFEFKIQKVKFSAIIMKLITLMAFIACAFLFTRCKNSSNTNGDETYAEKVIEMEFPMLNDTTPKVTGIGGIFFRSMNPKQIAEWYGKNLGLAIDENGSVFEFRNAKRPDQVNYLRWSPFNQETEYFKPSEKEFMINYRVQNIDGLVKKLKANGVEILDEIAEYEYGKFVHILDLEGNKIELWEPNDSFLTKIGGETTK